MVAQIDSRSFPIALELILAAAGGAAVAALAISLPRLAALRG
ncbi:MAG: hypothetical protein JWM33_559, partial [Caulobacteraceae bacterium]|nr:hypothetical protein [Caulobacteraceae bacterium]